MRTPLAVLALAAAIACSSYPPEAPEDLDPAFARAQAAGKPLVVHFTMKSCVPCRILEEEVWPHERVQEELSNFVFEKIDIEEHPELAAYHEVAGVPDVRVFSPDREQIARLLGWSPADAPEKMARFLAGTRE